MVSFEASKKGLELIACIEPSVPSTIIGDSGRIRQIMVNLLSNAVKFSSEGEVVLHASSKQNTDGTYEITMSVHDNGIGIADEDKHKLFQVFTQLDNSATRKHGGTGLGLSICRKLAELMPGKIWFEPNPGRGSIFHTCIRATAVPKELLWNLPSFQKPLKCGIIDQSETFANHLKMLLESMGNQAMCFQNVQDIGDVECLFVDARMLDSPALPNTNTKLVITSYTTQHTKRPVDAYLLQKPLRESKLRQILDQIRSNTLPTVSYPSTPPLASFTDSIPSDLSIMLAEDNTMNQQIITRMLANVSSEFEVCIVNNGTKAVEQVRSRYFDLVLMDIMMPAMGGIEATEIIRKELGERPIIVALTANAFAEDRARCLEAGMQEVVTKPVQKSELLKVLKMFFTKNDT
mmetsp:Transcript_17958/g.25053  ORF Transcript_17958/g.25053 Transcript_17958/m.25053 type:complete len:405 (+) Transcript_17958:1407-2621(+)